MTLVAFWPVLRCGFVNFDDPEYVIDNPRVHKGLTADNIRWAFTTFRAANWHPLTWLSLQADCTLHGNAEPFGFHLTNLLLHLGCTLLLFLTLRVLTGAVWRSALVAALFAVHPLHVESVAWVSERKDVLSTFFWCLTLAAYGWYVRRPGVGRYLAVATTFALGLLAKPMLVTLPCVLLLLDYWPLRRLGGMGGLSRPGPMPGTTPTARPTLMLPVLEKAPLFALALVSCVVTWWAQQHGGAVMTLQQYTPLVRVANAIVSYAGYLQQCVWPRELAAFYPHPGNTLAVSTILWSSVLLAVLTALCLGLARRAPYHAVGWLWFLGTLVPVIGIVQVGEQARADRYTYVPLIGVFVVASWAAGNLARRWPFLRGALALAALVALSACVQQTWKQSQTWTNSYTLWTHALEVTDDNWLAHIDLALDYGGRNPAEAVEHLREAVRIRPDYPLGHLNLGLYLAQLGQTEEAERCYRLVLDGWPAIAIAHTNLAMLLLSKGEPSEARRHLEEAVQLDAHYDKAHYGLGQVLIRQGDVAAAVNCFRRAAELRPERVQYRFHLASTLEELGFTDEAVKVFLEAGGADASFPAKARQEAWRLAAASDAKQGQAAWAVHLARIGCHGSEAASAAALDTLAAALAAAGRFPEAVALAERARAAALVAGDDDLAARIRRRAELFRAERAFRGTERQ
jgi:Tfp pilus assembly protein PilF